MTTGFGVRGRERLLASLALVAAVACAREQRTETTLGGNWVPVHPTTHEAAVAAIFVEGLGSSGYPENDERLPLTVGVWADGTVLWRKTERAAPGHAYRMGSVDPAACEHLLATLEGVMRERDGKQCSYAVLDTAHDILVVRDGETLRSMRSCIDRFEKNPDLVATSGGIQSRKERTAPTAEPAAERGLNDFRDAWASAKQSLLSLIPQSSEDVSLRAIEYTWVGPERH